MKRTLKILKISSQKEMFKIFTARTKRSEVVARVLNFLIILKSLNYKILNV